MTKEQMEALGLSTMENPFDDTRREYVEVPIFMYKNPQFWMRLDSVYPISWDKEAQKDVNWDDIEL